MLINESAADRVIRGVAAVAVAAAGLLVGASTPAAIVLFVIAAILAVTAVVGSCPIYGLLRVNTRRRTNRGH
jgi:hypothetical protein